MQLPETTITFSLELKASTQARTSRSNRPTGSIQEVEKATFQAINYVISDVAFYATKQQQNDIQRQVKSRMHGIVMSELSTMARKISKYGIGLGSQHTGIYPIHTLTIEGEKSSTLATTDPSRVAPMSIRSVTGTWRQRTEEYLKRKSKKYGHRRWWLNTGDLRQALSDPSTYTGAYGPIRVQWKPERMGSRVDTAARFSDLARGRGRTLNLQVGTLHLSVLGRITPQMLANPGQPAFNSKFNGLFSSMPEEVENKLLGWYRPRPLIEPFLTFYLNRQIPNRVWKALENSIRSR